VDKTPLKVRKITSEQRSLTRLCSNLIFWIWTGFFSHWVASSYKFTPSQLYSKTPLKTFEWTRHSLKLVSINKAKLWDFPTKKRDGLNSASLDFDIYSMFGGTTRKITKTFTHNIGLIYLFFYFASLTHIFQHIYPFKTWFKRLYKHFCRPKLGQYSN